MWENAIVTPIVELEAIASQSGEASPLGFVLLVDIDAEMVEFLFLIYFTFNLTSQPAFLDPFLFPQS